MVEITANDGEAITNELIRGEIHGLKTDENGTGLGGAVIGLFKSDESEFTAENAIAHRHLCGRRQLLLYRCAIWKLGAERAGKPEGFVLSDEIFSVTIEDDGQVVEISLANERVYGDLRLTKVDKDYPDNKLTVPSLRYIVIPTATRSWTRATSCWASWRKPAPVSMRCPISSTAVCS